MILTLALKMKSVDLGFGLKGCVLTIYMERPFKTRLGGGIVEYVLPICHFGDYYMPCFPRLLRATVKLLLKFGGRR